VYALAGSEAIVNWGWQSADDVALDIPKIQGIGLGTGEQSCVVFGDAVYENRSRVYSLVDEGDWLRVELINSGGRWLVDDWSHSFGPPGQTPAPAPDPTPEPAPEPQAQPASDDTASPAGQSDELELESEDTLEPEDEEEEDLLES